MVSTHGDDASEVSVSEFDPPTGEFGDLEPDESGQLSDDAVFGLLKNQRRRDTLRFLNEHGGTSTLSELAEHIAAKENDIEVRQLSSDQRKRVYIGLYQCHLPKLDSADVIDFDKNRGDVELRPAASQLVPYIDGTVDTVQRSDSDDGTDAAGTAGDNGASDKTAGVDEAAAGEDASADDTADAAASAGSDPADGGESAADADAEDTRTAEEETNAGTADAGRTTDDTTADSEPAEEQPTDASGSTTPAESTASERSPGHTDVTDREAEADGGATVMGTAHADDDPITPTEPSTAVGSTTARSRGTDAACLVVAGIVVARLAELPFVRRLPLSLLAGLAAGGWLVDRLTDEERSR